MTNKFRELTERLAMGMNRDDHFAILISGHDDPNNDEYCEDFNITANASERGLWLSSIELCKLTFAELSEAWAQDEYLMSLKGVIAEYEQRRFNEKEIEE